MLTSIQNVDKGTHDREELKRGTAENPGGGRGRRDTAVGIALCDVINRRWYTLQEAVCHMLLCTTTYFYLPFTRRLIMTNVYAHTPMSPTLSIQKQQLEGDVL